MPGSGSRGPSSDRPTARSWYRRRPSIRTIALLTACLVVATSVGGPAVAVTAPGGTDDPDTPVVPVTQPGPITVSPSPAAVGAAITLSATDSGAESYPAPADRRT